MSLPCLICDREFKDVFPEGEAYNQPYGGTAFTSMGHYGSTVFDPMDGSWLELTICDECLVKNKDKILECRQPDLPFKPMPTETKKWEP